MGRYAKQSSEGGSFQDPPVGTHVARCVRIIDLGTQEQEWQGKKKKRNQVVVQWELPEETIDIDGKPMPMLCSRFYTNDLWEKSNLYKDLVAWRGKPFTQEELDGFDLENILGAPCLVTIAEKENGNGVKVTGVSKLVKGQKCPPQVSESSCFWIDPWDDNAFHALPEGFQKLIAKSDEYIALHTAGRRKPKQDDGYDSMRRPDEETDDIPF